MRSQWTLPFTPPNIRWELINWHEDARGLVFEFQLQTNPRITTLVPYESLDTSLNIPMMKNMC